LTSHQHTISLAFHAPPPSQIYALSLHDALPIYEQWLFAGKNGYPKLPTGLQYRWNTLIKSTTIEGITLHDLRHFFASGLIASGRSEEHTSELQSRFDLVCRLLLEKKNRIGIDEI